MADPTTLEFPKGAVNQSLKQLRRPEISQMNIAELRIKLKQAQPWGYVDASTPQEIDEMNIETAREALDEASERARSRSV